MYKRQQFTADISCSFTSNSLFTAPSSCQPSCTISNLSAGSQTTCSDADNTYTQEVIVSYSNKPSSGFLNVNDQYFLIGTSPQTVTLTDLPANGNDVDVVAKFTADADCSVAANALFTAPSSCSESTCAIFTRADLGLAISDGAASSVSSTVSLNGNLSVTDINVLSVVGNHDYFQDLQFTLTGPDNTSAILFSGVSGCNYICLLYTSPSPRD